MGRSMAQLCVPTYRRRVHHAWRAASGGDVPTISICRLCFDVDKHALSPALTDYNKQRALRRDRFEPGQLRQQPPPLGTRISLSEHAVGTGAVGRTDNWGLTAQVANVVFCEPVHDLVERMPSLVRIVVLVLDPGLGFEWIADSVAHYVVDLRPQPRDQTCTQRGRYPREPVVEADNHDAAWLHL